MSKKSGYSEDMDILKKILGDYEAFLLEIVTKVESKFDVDDFVQLDVLCYRTPTPESYQEKKRSLEKVGVLLSEEMVSGRPIATFRLDVPIYFKQWRIDTIELPAPKQGSAKPEGLEHIQFVLFDDLHTYMRKYGD